MLLEISSSQSPDNQLQVPCRVCGQVGLNSVISRDDQPVVQESKWPVDLAWCPTCSLVQWTDEGPGDGEMAESSVGIGRTPREECQWMAHGIVEARQLNGDSLVVEIAAADTDLLTCYQGAGVPVMSIQPVRNVEADAEAKIDTICGAFDHELALELVHSQHRADVVHAGGTFAHLANLNGVVSGIATLLKPDGIVVVEVSYLKDLANRVGFNTLSREELCYFSLTSLTQLFGQHGLEIVDVQRRKACGGTLRIMAARSGTMCVSPAVHELMADEIDWVRDAGFYQSFGETLAPSSHDRWAA